MVILQTVVVLIRVLAHFRAERQPIVVVFYRDDGKNWELFDKGFEVSGYHHNILSGFSSLMVGLAASGEGDVIFSRFRYLGLD
jgi:beta-xylosidase